MADMNCTACEDLRATAPDFIANGLSDEACASLANDTGYVPSKGHNDCKDLNDANDCLIGLMAPDTDRYDVCEWKPFLKHFISNLHQFNKSVLCSICGMWEQIHCTYNSLVNLVNRLTETTSGVSFIRYYRDLGAGSAAVPYWENITDGFDATLDIYMNSEGANGGNLPADRDYLVFISNCTNFKNFNKMEGRVTFFSSGDTRDPAVIRQKQAQHPSISQSTHSETHALVNFSWTTSGAVLIKKGEHVRVNFHVQNVDKGSSTAAGAPSVRLHQFVLVWMPVNITEPLDPTDILEC